MSFQQGLSRLYNFLAGGHATGLFFFLVPLLFYAGAAPFRDLYGIEARNALFAREMLENGISFIPHLLGRPYPDYPPLYFLLEYIFSLPAGRVTTLTAVLPSALSAAGIVWLSWHWTSRVSRHLAVCACLILVASPGFWLKASHATVDMLLALETLAAFYFLSRAWPEPGTAAKGRQAYSMLCGAACLFAAFITKGPVGLIIPLGAWGFFLIMERRWKELASFALYSSAGAALLVCIYLALVYAQGKWPLVLQVIENQITGRVGTEPNRPWYYYAVYVFTSFLPWWFLPVVIPALVRKGILISRICKDDATDFPDHDQGLSIPRAGTALQCGELLAQYASGMFFTVALFSMASSRHGRYLLPAFPFIAVLIAAGINVVSAKVYETYGAGYMDRAGWFRKAGFMIMLTAGVVAAGMLTNSFIIEPGISAQESGRSFMEETECRTPAGTPIVIYRINPDGDGLKLALYSRSLQDLRFAGSSNFLSQTDYERYILVMYEKRREEVEGLLDGKSLKVIAKGLVHRKKVVAIFVRAKEMNRQIINKHKKLPKLTPA